MQYLPAAPTTSTTILSLQSLTKIPFNMRMLTLFIHKCMRMQKIVFFMLRHLCQSYRYLCASLSHRHRPHSFLSYHLPRMIHILWALLSSPLPLSHHHHPPPSPIPMTRIWVDCQHWQPYPLSSPHSHHVPCPHYIGPRSSPDPLVATSVHSSSSSIGKGRESSCFDA